jgi:hypothetical protein
MALDEPALLHPRWDAPWPPEPLVGPPRWERRLRSEPRSALGALDLGVEEGLALGGDDGNVVVLAGPLPAPEHGPASVGARDDDGKAGAEGRGQVLTLALGQAHVGGRAGEGGATGGPNVVGHEAMRRGPSTSSRNWRLRAMSFLVLTDLQWKGGLCRGRSVAGLRVSSACARRQRPSRRPSDGPRTPG